MRGLRSRSKAIASLVVLACLGTATAHAAKGTDVYRGETEDGRAMKLVADRAGAVIRGAATTETHCGKDFKPFRARFEFGRPLDRSSPDRFRAKGSNTEEDGKYSARYRYDVRGERRGPHRLDGSFDLEVVFRKLGEKYATCRASEVAFSALSGKDGAE